LNNIFSSIPMTKLKKLTIGIFYMGSPHYISELDLQSIPSSVEEIVFDYNFNQPLDYLPAGIKKITFGKFFNHLINFKNLPTSIEYLEFGYCYNKTIHEYPPNLKILKFGRNYSSKIFNLPHGLIKLEINEKFSSLILDLPTTLEILKFDENSEYSQLDKLELPNSIKILQLGKLRSPATGTTSYIKNLPSSLEYIKYCKSNKKIKKIIDDAGWTGKIEYW